MAQSRHRPSGKLASSTTKTTANCLEPLVIGAAAFMVAILLFWTPPAVQSYPAEQTSPALPSR